MAKKAAPQTPPELTDQLQALLAATGPWISKEFAAARAGITEGIIRGYIDAHWKRGYHYKVKGRVTYVHYDRMQAWIDSLEDSADDPTESESESTATRKRSSTKRSRGTPIPQLS